MVDDRPIVRALPLVALRVAATLVSPTALAKTPLPTAPAGKWREPTADASDLLTPASRDDAITAFDEQRCSRR